MRTITVEESLLYDSRCFAAWLYHFRERITSACYRENISLDTYKEGILKMIRRSGLLPGRFRFESDVIHASTKEQILERCETAIKNAGKIRRKIKK